MSTRTPSTWRIAFAVFLGVTAAQILMRGYDAFMERQRTNEAVHELNKAMKDSNTEAEEALRRQYLQRAEDQAADERLKKRLAEELARRASAPD